MRARSPIAWVALLCLCSGTAWSLDLKQAYELALDQDATFQAARANADVGRENLPQARAGLLPNVSASVSRSINQLANTAPNLLGRDVTTDYRYVSRNDTLTLRQPLIRHQLWAKVRQASAQLDDANALLDSERRELLGRVANAYFEALLAQDQLETAQVQQATYATHVDAAKRLFASGAGTRTDVDDAQSRLDLSVAQALEARQHVEYTRRQLQVMVNQPVDQLARLTAEHFAPAPLLPDSLDEWNLRAERSNPDIRSLQARLMAAQEEVTVAQSGHLPTVDVVAQISRSGGESLASPQTRSVNQLVGLQVNIPLYAGGGVSSVVRQAQAAKARAEQTLEAARRELGLRVHKEYRGVTEGALRIKALEQALHSAEQALASNQRSFQGGSRTRMDVLNAESQRATVWRDLCQARYVYLLSLLRLRALSGEPNDESVAGVNAWLVH